MIWVAGNREGIGCRLKCLVSVMRLHDDYRLYWEINDRLQCDWSNLFENNILVNKQIKKHVESRQAENLQGTYVYYSWRWDTTEREREKYGRKYFDYLYNKMPKPIYDGIVKQIDKLIPIKYCRDEIAKYKDKFDENTVSVCVRTWKDVRGTDKERPFHYNWVFEHTDKIPEKSKMFLTSDNEKSIMVFRKRYGDDRLIYYPKRTTWGDFNSIEGMQDTLIELYFGGSNSKMYLSWHSGFTEAQWWFGGAKAKAIEIAPYKAVL